MKTLHSIKPEKQKLDWKDIKFDLMADFSNLNDAFTRFEDTVRTYTTSLPPYNFQVGSSSVYIDGQYIGDAGDIRINEAFSDNQWHNVVYQTNPIQYWRLGDVTDGAV